MIRLIVPDAHGSMADHGAVRALLGDLKTLDPGEIVFLGDFVDVGGVFSTHPRNYIEELEYSYEEDCAAANRILDKILGLAPRATSLHFIEGNHCAHLERWCSRTFTHKRDAEATRSAMAPQYKLRLKDRGIKYYRTTDRYMGLSIPGTIKLGRCLFTHGYRAGKYATAAHLDDFGTNIVHGHTHRAQSIIRRTVASGEIGAWCPGTLSALQPTYLHNSVSSWSHGYAIQMVERDGRFIHIQVPINNGRSMLGPLLKELRPRHTGRRAA